MPTPYILFSELSSTPRGSLESRSRSLTCVALWFLSFLRVGVRLGRKSIRMENSLNYLAVENQTTHLHIINHKRLFIPHPPAETLPPSRIRSP
jgi:hypothetical protein